MRLSGYVLELADGSLIQVGQSPYTSEPLILKADVPVGRLPAFTDSNPPKGMRRSAQASQQDAMLTVH